MRYRVTADIKHPCRRARNLSPFIRQHISGFVFCPLAPTLEHRAVSVS
jgi:hypothetical protein